MKRFVCLLISLVLTTYVYGSDLNHSSKESLIPVGMVSAFPTSAVPDGWLYCNGQAVSRTGAYASLFSVIGIIYGPGNASTTFNLPDTRGEFIRGYDHSATVDPDAASRTDRGDGTGGDNVGSKQANATKRPNSSYTSNSTGVHTHNGAHNWGSGSAAGNCYYAKHPANSGAVRYANWPVASTGNHTHSITGGGDNESRPPNINVRFYIKY